MAPDPDIVYYPDNQPGIQRKRQGRGFSYFAADGTRIDRGGELERLKAMAVPPAYKKVWMTPLRNGHLSATGYDSRARKQYRYHPDWSKARSETKFSTLADFGRLLPQIRRRIERDLNTDAGERSFALAAAAALIDRLSLRVGNEDYARENGSHGAVTLKRRHVRIAGDAIHLSFVAKGGERVRHRVADMKLMRTLAKARDLPGAELLTWIDDEGDVHRIGSSALNVYLQDAASSDQVTAKTFRTWAGTLAAFRLALQGEPRSIKAMTGAAAKRLGNTPAVARNSYIHPNVIELAGQPFSAPDYNRISGLLADEARLLAFLESV